MQIISTVPPVTPTKCGTVWVNPNRVPANISIKLFGPGVMEATNIMAIRGETMISIWLKRVHRKYWESARTIATAAITQQIQQS
jgi:hypothetical protein